MAQRASSRAAVLHAEAARVVTLSTLRVRAGAHGVDGLFLGGVVLSAVLAALSGRVSIELRVGANTTYNGGILDTAVVVGIALPCGVLGWALTNRAVWLSATSSRSPVRRRAEALLAMHCFAAVVLGGVALLLADLQSATMVLSDAVLLYGLAVTSSVVLGGELGWVLPICAALIATAPGLVPLEMNVLVALERQPLCLALGGAVVAAASAIYVLFGTARSRRLG